MKDQDRLISGSQLPAWSRLWCQICIVLTLKPLTYSLPLKYGVDTGYYNKFFAVRGCVSLRDISVP